MAPCDAVMGVEFPTFCLACPWEMLTCGATALAVALEAASEHDGRGLGHGDYEHDPACENVEVGPCNAVAGSTILPVDHHNRGDCDRMRNRVRNKREWLAFACRRDRWSRCEGREGRIDCCCCCSWRRYVAACSRFPMNDSQRWNAHSREHDGRQMDDRTSFRFGDHSSH